LAGLHVRPKEERDRDAVEEFLAGRHSARVARLGRLEDALAHPALIAERDGELAGVATYVIHGSDCELLTLHAAERFGGTGTALLAAVEAVASGAGCTRLWLITTNDNLDALRFYQRRGFRLAALHVGAVDASRERLKPEIPALGDHGIGIRDEIQLEKPMQKQAELPE
jgi:GNAT superfamily N-acetyltransferase